MLCSMGSMVGMLLWGWIILDSGVCSVLLPEITDGKFIAECVSEHNKARSSVSPSAENMLYMTWDQGLAITARAWAKHCIFGHNIYSEDVRRMHPTFPSVGENIWTGSTSLFNVTSAIEGWVNEKAHYSYQNNGCSYVCGHYTQVVWENSYKVGCAAHLCPNGVTNFNRKEGVVFVCNYAPAGNINSRKPYKSGQPCAGCNDSCVDQLCSNQDRDSQKSYTWSPDWDPDTATGSHYVIILIVRIVALILTFLTAYVICYCYPDVFCYE